MRISPLVWVVGWLVVGCGSSGGQPSPNTGSESDSGSQAHPDGATNQSDASTTPRDGGAGSDAGSTSDGARGSTIDGAAAEGSTHDAGGPTVEAGPPPGCLAAPSGMIGFWPGDNDVNDVTGAHAMTWCGWDGFDDACGTVTPAYVPGEVGQAFSFDGNDFVRSLAFTLSGTPFTVDLWALWGSTSELEWSSTLAADEGDNLGTTFQMDSDGNGGQRVQAGNDVIHVTLGPVSTSAFHHIAMVFDGSKVSTFTDGSPVSSGDWSMELDVNSLKFGMNRTYDRPYTGAVDEVHIFNRALAASEIQAIYAAGGAGICH